MDIISFSAPSPCLTTLTSICKHCSSVQLYLFSWSCGRKMSPHSPPTSQWKQLRKQQSLTAERFSRSSSPSSPSSSPPTPSSRPQLKDRNTSLSPVAVSAVLMVQSHQSFHKVIYFFASEKLSCHSKPSPSPTSQGSARYLPKQYSCTSNGSAYLSPQVVNFVKSLEGSTTLKFTLPLFLMKF